MDKLNGVSLNIIGTDSKGEQWRIRYHIDETKALEIPAENGWWYWYEPGMMEDTATQKSMNSYGSFRFGSVDPNEVKTKLVN